MNELQYTVVFQSQQGDRYLSSIESHCYGERLLGFFDLAKSCAMPLPLDQAVRIRNKLKESLPCHHLYVIPVPWDLSGKEVNANG